MEATKEMAYTMARWWGDKVNGSAHHDNGDRGLTSTLCGIFADSFNVMADKSQIDKFVDVLTEKIWKELNEKNYISSSHLYCDYGPSKFLSDAAKEAGINPDNFPWKTGMIVSEDPINGKLKVLVRAGYGSPTAQIWPKQS